MTVLLQYLLYVLYSYKESIHVGSLSTLSSAEIVAILRCTELLMTKNVTKRRIHICFDRRAALAAFAKTTTESFWFGDACKR